MKRRVLAALAALTLGAGLAVATAPEASALGKVKCKQTVGVASVDPIVHHNESNAMVHSHQFFGNNGWLSKGNFANYSDLVGQGTNCREVLDTAGYWTPTLRYKATGQEIGVQAFTAYYRPFSGVGGPDVGEGRAFPADTRLVASVHSWTCGQYMSVPPSQTVPNCTGADGSPGKTLTLHIDFPSCWDGVAPNHSSSEVGNTQDTAHYAYRVKSGKTYSCPAGFPYKMTALRETLQFKYVGAGNDVELSSDPMMGGSDGSTAHGDFWNTWDQKGFESFIANCVNRKSSNSVCQK